MSGQTARRARASLVLLAALLAGCTRESLRVALQTQRRADELEQALFEREHDALRVLLYRDLIGRLAEAGARLDGRQRAVVSAVWNDRDLIEFWAMQHERARALRLIGVDAKLLSDQSIVELLYKSLAARAARAGQALARQAGEALAKGARRTGRRAGQVAGDGQR